jgi:uncharacterized protein YjbI with pentapeptide repeats
VNLSEAGLTGADLYDADLRNANLTDADLRYAYLTGTDLRHANLSHANLTWAKLAGAYLDYVTFSPGTTLYGGQTVAQHGFDAASLQTYLVASPISASRAINLTIVPEPTTLLLALLALVAAPLRVRCG